MIPDRSTFESAYAGQAPWDIGRPQKPFIDMADRIIGSVLDAGCGTGETALLFAGRGCHVTGIDFIDEAINRARRKAAERVGPGVNHAVADGGVIGPGGDEAPTEQGQLAAVVILADPDGRHRLSRGDVVAGRQVRDLRQAEEVGDGFARSPESESAAHG
jgi:SAM-dependent methyltransferase